MIQETQARVRHLFNPLNVDGTKTQLVAPGTTIRSLAPKTPLPHICVRNGTPILRRFWDEAVSSGDQIEFHILPEGGGGKSPLRIILTVALIVAVAIFAPQLVVAFGQFAPTVALLAGSALINLIAPIKSPLANTGADFGSPSSTYDASLAGNAARLDSPIPVIYGRHLRYPDFAAQPYTEYVDNDQYFTALFCIGMGDHSVERIMIDDTKIENFNDVTTPVIIHPNESLPDWLDPTCFNSSEVSGQEIIAGKPLGPFMVTDPAGPVPSEIWFDFVMSNGLYRANATTGDLEAYTIRIQIDMRAVNSFGNPTESWYGLDTIEIIAGTREAIRKTYKFPVNVGVSTEFEPVPHTNQHFEIRVTRITAKVDNALIVDTINWTAMRCFTSPDFPPTLEPRATYLAIRIRSSEQLAGLSQRKINVIATRILPKWDNASRAFTSNAATRSIQDILADILVNDAYGAGIDTRRVDMDTLTELGTLWAARQDWCDLIFDSKTTVWDALRTVARCGRAIPLVRGGQFTFVRDGQQDLPAAMFSNRTIVKDSLNIEYVLPNETTADAVYLEYFSHLTWDFQKVLCLAPGVVTPTNPTTVRLLGITGASQATREGIFIIADSYYRRRITSWTSEYDGFIPSYGSLVAVSHDLPGWGQSGDVTDWHADTLVMELSEPVTFELSGTHYIIFQRDDGSVSTPVVATRLPDARQVKLVSDPGVVFSFDDPGRESTKYIFGTGDYRVFCKVINLTPAAENKVQLQAVVEDDRVHEADNGYLPAPGQIQDPVVDTTTPPDGTEPDPGSGTLVGFVNVVTSSFEAGLGTAGYAGGPVKVVFTSDGFVTFHDGATVYPTNFTRDEWYSFRPTTVLYSSQFEMRATILVPLTWHTNDISPFPDPGSYPEGVFGAWVSMGATNEWGFNGPSYPDDSGFTDMTIRFEIRAAAAFGGALQLTKDIYLLANARASSGGGGGGD